MIPKIIHYCWLSDDPLSLEIKQCILSWKKYLSDYELVLWDRKRFDISSNIWVKQAYENKKYAFAADYIRLYALYTYGGIYLDSDVQVLKSFDDLLELPYFIGVTSNQSLEAAVIGCEKECDWIRLCLNYYTNRSFLTESDQFDLTTLPKIMYKQIESVKQIVYISESTPINYHSDDELYLFPFDYFCCKRGNDGKVLVTSNSYSIHHFAMSWRSPFSVFLIKIKRLFITIFGDSIINVIIRIFSLGKLKDLLDKRFLF